MSANSTRETSFAARFEESVLARAGARDRASIEKHVATCDAEPDAAHAHLWRRLAGMLASLAPLPVQTVGGQALLFFVPDGKYRMQVFALEDKRDSFITLYLPDVLTQAAREKIVHKDAGSYSIPGSRAQQLNVQVLSAATFNDPPTHVKNLIGWNRKALRVSLKASELDSAQVKAVESLCTLAAKQWANAVATAAAR